MNSELAERLLINVMNWDEEIVARERPLIQRLSTYKFDEYQQFSPGMRFIESFAFWLRQFEENERDVLYEFIKSRLIFFANSELQHFVSITYPDIIRGILIETVARREAISSMQIKKIVNSDHFNSLLRKSLFLGLSDGARIDYFRRINQAHISNEQIWLTYEISNEKAKGLLKDLKRDLNNNQIDSEDSFEMVFLLDDFSASGTSYFRKENDQYNGKIFKVLKKFLMLNGDTEEERFAENNDFVRKLINPNNLEIHIIIYVMTESAKQNLSTVIEEWKQTYSMKIKIKIHPIQLIQDSSKITNSTAPEIIEIIKNPRYFDLKIIDEHWKKGKHDEPYLGYNECSLPLIMSHNTPNNSLPILWFENASAINGLFPRISRHKSE